MAQGRRSRALADAGGQGLLCVQQRLPSSHLSTRALTQPLLASVYLFGVGPEDGCTGIVPGTHLLHAQPRDVVPEVAEDNCERCFAALFTIALIRVAFLRALCSPPCPCTCMSCVCRRDAKHAAAGHAGRWLRDHRHEHLACLAPEPWHPRARDGKSPRHCWHLGCILRQ